MKKYSVIALLIAATMLSACSAGNAEPETSDNSAPTETTSETKSTTTTTSQTAKAPRSEETEEEPPVSPDVVVNGLLDSDVVYEIYGGGDRDVSLTLGFCCVIPYGTPFEEREENYLRLYSSTSRASSDNTWNGLEVISASSSYGGGSWEPLKVQSVRLGGEITLKGKLSVNYDIADNPWGLVLILDEESRQMMPVLTEYYFREDAEYETVEPDIGFLIFEDPEESRYDWFAELLGEQEEIDVAVVTDDFSLSYTNFGLQTDGGTRGRFHNIISITAE